MLSLPDYWKSYESSLNSSNSTVLETTKCPVCSSPAIYIIYICISLSIAGYVLTIAYQIFRR